MPWMATPYQVCIQCPTFATMDGHILPTLKYACTALPLPPWMATASTPFSSRYSCIASTSCFFSAKINTCPTHTQTILHPQNWHPATQSNFSPLTFSRIQIKNIYKNTKLPWLKHITRDLVHIPPSPSSPLPPIQSYLHVSGYPPQKSSLSNFSNG